MYSSASLRRCETLTPDLCKMITVTQYYRRPLPMGHFSIESYFNTIAASAPADIKIKKVIAPAYSRGLFARLWIAIHAMVHQSQVNHITGDIHFIAPFLSRSRTILTIHDCGQLKIKKGLAFHVLKFFWFTLPCKWVNKITVNSEYTKQDLLSYIDISPDKITVIPIFVSDIYQRQDKPFNQEKPTIVQIGTAHNKNINRTLEALKDIHCHLIILGRLAEDQKQKLIKYNIEHTLIERPISDQELYELYKQADILTLISTLEGFGMPIVEANKVGRVVITSNCTSMPWVAGDAAHLVDPLDVEDMKKGFIKIISDEVYRNSLKANGYNNAIRFDSHTIAGTYNELYKKLVA